jgi:hypothetical protein
MTVEFVTAGFVTAKYFTVGFVTLGCWPHNLEKATEGMSGSVENRFVVDFTNLYFGRKVLKWISALEIMD